ncbi:hypothetical protein B0T22DRAFT_457818 [Podospora appendiculata]|uniref:Uncharacterized protein n=1 Tax=Podospora appendiculata TaxID=314037 RepID=A0AAE0X7T6_9PEZI|nr:hypothetical protein B0T22DRAFT_457818 [Podospora appendiculata]
MASAGEESLTRHYPLDIPSLPFDRYEHLPITERDILAHRIMASILKPSRLHAELYSTPIGVPIDFDDFEVLGPQLAADVHVLHKLLFTCSIHTRRFFCHCEIHSPQGCLVWLEGILNFRCPCHFDDETVWKSHPAVKQKRTQGKLTFGDVIMDLLNRHYFETDDAALRTWISLAASPPVSQGPWTRTPSSRGYGMNRPYLAQQYRLRFNQYMYRQGKTWSGNHESHVRAIRSKMTAQKPRELYDGGAFIPGLLQHFFQFEFLAHEVGGDVPGSRPNTIRWTQLPGYQPVNPEKPPTSMRYILQEQWTARIMRENMFSLGDESLPLDLSLNRGRGRCREGIWSTRQRPQGPNRRHRRRSASEPPEGSFMTADLCLLSPASDPNTLEFVFPRMTLAQLDKRSRRRSLSRTRIQEMFDWNIGTASIPGSIKKESNSNKPPGSPSSTPEQANEQPRSRHPLRCQNCAGTDHYTLDCVAPCGFCGAPNPKLTNFPPPSEAKHRKGVPLPPPGFHREPHIASACKVAPRNRCKCVPFPQFHTAEHCQIPCRRDCRNDSPKHNAMLCRSRCCMCGLRNHSGKQCRQRHCRCGGAHLGQDCTWKATCKVAGCDRFVCGLHCRDCGSDEKPIVQRQCWRCRGLESRPPLAESQRINHKPRKRRDGLESVGGREAEVKEQEPSGEIMGEDKETQKAGQAPYSETHTHIASIFGDP